MEFVVVVIAIGILAGLLLDRVLPLIGRAERVAFEQMQSQINSALLLEAAVRVTRGQSATLAELAGANPMSLLLKPPGNYLGVLDRPDVTSLPRGSWYFDGRERRLVYRPSRQARFESDGGPDDRIELAVAFIYGDRDGDGQFDPARDDFGGLRLESIYPYEWAAR